MYVGRGMGQTDVQGGGIETVCQTSSFPYIGQLDSSGTCNPYPPLGVAAVGGFIILMVWRFFADSGLDRTGKWKSEKSAQGRSRGKGH